MKYDIFRASTVAVYVAMVTIPSATAQDRQDWPSDLTIGTASQGGTLYSYGAGVGAVVAEELGLIVNAEITGGPVQNVTLVQTGEHDIGLVTMGPMYEAWTGVSELAPGLEHRDVRALFPMYTSAFHAVALASHGVTGVSDLDGHRVSVGPAGGTPGTYWPRMFEALGIAPSVSFTSGADAADQLKDGLIDGYFFAAGLPVSSFSQLSAEADVTIFGFTPEEQEQLLAEFPSVAPFTIPANTYPDQSEALASLAMWNFAVVNASMPENLAYEITKLVLGDNARMLQIHAAARETLTENWVNNSFLPFHPGAVRYLEEQGINVPAELRG
ncbi:TAXI family TRAP transporter solute-binding subunit [Pararhodobacter oceanensis]|uniref:TAXI family TRAP transporter solute-binding subunit n=1 Tax=Pararhodobacter oceanensis TaxID=2172121 RepID=UPI003A8E9932